MPARRQRRPYLMAWTRGFGTLSSSPTRPFVAAYRLDDTTGRFARVEWTEHRTAQAALRAARRRGYHARAFAWSIASTEHAGKVGWRELPDPGRDAREQRALAKLLRRHA
jgi:hypothetical protein